MRPRPIDTKTRTPLLRRGSSLGAGAGFTETGFTDAGSGGSPDSRREVVSFFL